MTLKEKYDDIYRRLLDEIDAYEYFMKNIKNFFESTKVKVHVHSLRFRLKDIDHLLEKIERKNNEDDQLPEGERKGHITAENIFERITDIAGIRVLHLHLRKVRTSS